MLGAAALAIVGHERREAIALAISGTVGAGVAWLGLAAAGTGGAAFDVPTSLDVFLIQTQQLGRLHSLFLERFRPKVAGYALWAWVPFSVLAVRRLRRPIGRLLLSWLAVTIVGVVVGMVWQPFPPHRIVACAMCLPLLAAIGTRLAADRFPRARTWIITGVIVCVAASATLAWVAAPRPFRDPSAVPATAAAAQVAQTTSGPVVVDLPDGANRTAVAVIRWTNLLRAAVPPDRIRDVIVRFPPPSSADDGDATGLWRSTEAQIRGTDAAAPVPELPPVGAPPSAAPSGSVAALVGAAAAWIAICGIVGFGWTYAAGLRGVRLLERSVGVGFGGLILAGSLVGRTGPLLGQRSTAIGVIVGMAGGGALAALASKARRPPVVWPRGADPTRTARGRLPSFHPSGTA
jgi:hypothetical protein